MKFCIEFHNFCRGIIIIFLLIIYTYSLTQCCIYDCRFKMAASCTYQKSEVEVISPPYPADKCTKFSKAFTEFLPSTPDDGATKCLTTEQCPDTSIHGDSVTDDNSSPSCVPELSPGAFLHVFDYKTGESIPHISINNQSSWFELDECNEESFSLHSLDNNHQSMQQNGPGGRPHRKISQMINCHQPAASTLPDLTTSTCEYSTSTITGFQYTQVAQSNLQAGSMSESSSCNVSVYKSYLEKNQPLVNFSGQTWAPIANITVLNHFSELKDKPSERQPPSQLCSSILPKISNYMSTWTGTSLSHMMSSMSSSDCSNQSSTYWPTTSISEFSDSVRHTASKSNHEVNQPSLKEMDFPEILSPISDACSEHTPSLPGDIPFCSTPMNQDLHNSSSAMTLSSSCDFTSVLTSMGPHDFSLSGFAPLKNDTTDTSCVPTDPILAVGDFSYCCNICTFKTSRLPELKQHIQSCTEQPLECPNCQKAMKSSAGLKLLLKKCGQAQCPKCYKCFSSQDQMKKHVYKKHVLQSTHDCDKCGASFDSVVSLSKHMYCHRGNRQVYTCMYCEGTFRTKSGRTRHLKIKHADKVELVDNVGVHFLQNGNSI